MPLTPPLTKKVLGSPSQYPADLQSWMAKVISGNKLFQIDWPQLPGPKITSQAISSGPPKTPTNGDIWIATGVDANGTVWQFRYNAKSASAYKWEFIGGSPLVSQQVGVPVNQVVAGAWQFLAGNPALVLPRAGDYVIQASASYFTVAAGAITGYMGIDILSVPLAPIVDIPTTAGAAGWDLGMAIAPVAARGLGIGETVRQINLTTVQPVTWGGRHRTLSLIPARVS